MPPANVPTPDADLDDRLSALLGELLAAEQQAVASDGAAQQDDLRRQIEQREAELADDNTLDALFDEFVDSQPGNALPSSFAAQSRMFIEWENGRRAELAEWQSQLENLANRPVDRQLIFDRAHRRIMQALNHAADDRAALVALYSATDGANWTNSANWLSDAPLDEWYGVTTDSEGNVTALQLEDNNLVGMIPGGLLENLANLESLHLSFNGLTGGIPAELGNLTNLDSLELHVNELTGEIPAELGNLTSLTWLTLSNNQLTGEIPAKLGNLTNLETLILADNELTGEIPATLGNIANLWQLHLSGNRFTGCIPTTWADVALNDLANLGLPLCDP